jgi:hypothetical protein
MWGRSRGKDPLVLNLGSRWRIVVGFTLRSLFPQVKSLQYFLNRSLGGAKGVFGRFGVEKNLLRLPGVRR